MRTRLADIRGSVVLVAMCFVVVLGISVASYLAFSTQAMNLSNRAFQSNVSAHLAEAGIERALAAFNSNDWSGWTISGTTATRTVTFASDKYGASGAATTINLRVDNYDAFMGSSEWNSSTAYSVGEIVGYNGTWYRCVMKNTNSTPSSTSLTWIQEQSSVPLAWSNVTNYAVEDVVHYDGKWYRCISAHTNQAPPNARWTLMPRVEPWSAVSYAAESVVIFSNLWYRSTGGSWDAFPAISWRWRSGGGKNYAVDDHVHHEGRWYRCHTAHSAHNSREPPDADYWAVANTTPSATSALSQWYSTTQYRLNDVVYQGGSWYRCILAHSNQQPPNATYWVNKPLRSHAWVGGKDYPANAVVVHNSVWYRCTAAHTSALNSPPPSGSWASAATTTWSSVTSYSVNDYVAYNGVWYRCIVANSNKYPNSATHWSAVNAPVIYSQGASTPLNSPAITTQLRATVIPMSVFHNAAGATNELRMQSGTVDSYDSSSGTYASQVNGANNFSAILAAGSTSSTAVAINSSLSVNGYVAAPGSSSAPHDPLATIAVAATVKGTAATPTPSVDGSRISRSPFIPEPAIQEISGGNLITGSWPISIGTPDAKSPTVYYINGNLLFFLSGTHILNVIGPVILDVRGSVAILAGRIRVASTGSLELHYSGTLGVAADGLINDTLSPKNMVLIGSGTGTATLQQTLPFYGAVYQPNGSIVVNSTMHIYGALSAKNVTFNTTANLHYDRELRHLSIRGVDESYSANELRELTTAAEKVSF